MVEGFCSCIFWIGEGERETRERERRGVKPCPWLEELEPVPSGRATT
jgi:hypothetical protein